MSLTRTLIGTTEYFDGPRENLHDVDSEPLMTLKDHLNVILESIGCT
ncbi:MAG: hypothetical protein ACJ70P_02540 [Nitrososphaera sp.]